MRNTHTFATLEISKAAYAEIRQYLEDAGYQHAFGTSDCREVIDMHGIGLVERQSDLVDDKRQLFNVAVKELDGDLYAGRLFFDIALDLVERVKRAERK